VSTYPVRFVSPEVEAAVREQDAKTSPKGCYEVKPCAVCGQLNVAHRLVDDSPHGHHIRGARHQKALAGRAKTLVEILVPEGGAT
jgi:hypothetical protein